MKEQNGCMDEYSQTISEAIESLRNKNANRGYKLISKALLINPDAPEPHNLLGILAELKGDDSVARKHYRAAYALDPTYKPACRNLERLVMFEWGPQNRDFDFGDTQINTEDIVKKGQKK